MLEVLLRVLSLIAAFGGAVNLGLGLVSLLLGDSVPVAMHFGTAGLAWYVLWSYERRRP
jgi:hypothetical protein